MQSITSTLGDLARTTPASTRVFLRHQLDFCCGGKQTLAEACVNAGLDPKKVLAEITAEIARGGSEPSWERSSQTDLVDYIEQRYHAALRCDLPPLIEAARKVERVHAKRESVPAGLAEVLSVMSEELEQHMRKEEMVLFPMLRRGARGVSVAMPLTVLEREHELHGEHLATIRAITNDLTLPPEACATWTALYRGLQTLEAELMQHIHLENNILFSRARAGTGTPY